MYPYANRQYGKFEQYSIVNKNEQDESYVVINIRILTHEIEKGFSLPTPHKGFGKEKLRKLDHLLNVYEQHFIGADEDAYHTAIATVHYYINSASEFELDISFLNHDRYKREELVECGVRVCHKNELKGQGIQSYLDFLKTRHSVRSFQDIELQQKDVEEAIIGAQRAPSACNRQSVKVFHVIGKERCQKVLTIQNGSKGFGTVNDIFVIAANLSSYATPLEINTGFVDCGLFAMSFLLSLHDLDIGTCPLLWNDETTRAEELRAVVAIPESYEIALIIPAGYYMDMVKFALSPRKPINMIYEKV